MPELTKTDISHLLPHGGSMCLLDAVEQWDRATIRCRASSHRDLQNPLRRAGGLGVVSGLEYAAQAMGVHIGLLHPNRQTKGFIGYVGGVRDVTIGVERLDDLSTDLVIDATQVFEDANSFVYQFEVKAGEISAMKGRASIFLKDATP